LLATQTNTDTANQSLLYTSADRNQAKNQIK
jgi:hypothetical protein